MRIAFLLLLFFLASQISAQTHGVGPDWGPEVPLPLFNSFASQRGVLFNNMALTSTGRIYISTVETNPSNGNIIGNFLTWSDDDGQTWAHPIPIEGMSKVIGSNSPKLETDQQDNLYVLFSGKQPAGVFLSKYDSNLSLLIDTVRVGTMKAYNSFATHLTVDAQNRLHVMWHEGDPDLGQITEVYYSRSTDGGVSWSPQIMLSNDDGHKSAFPRVQLKAASGDLIAIAWRDSIGIAQKWDVYMAVSEDGGSSWSASFPVVQSNDLNSDPDVVIDNQDRIHLFFHRYPVNNLFNGAYIGYGWSDDKGNTWQPAGWKQLSEPGKRSHLAEGECYDVLNNILWAVWKDERDVSLGGGPDIMLSYSTDRGNTWSEPEFATDHDTLAIGFKAGTNFPDGSYALNYEATEPTGKLRVYFRKRNAVNTSQVETTANPDMTLWPQPADNTVFFNNPTDVGLPLCILDCYGRKLKQTTAFPGINEIDVSQLPAGMYVLHLSSSDFSFGKKLLISR